jgi:hypothetical protein
MTASVIAGVGVSVLAAGMLLQGRRRRPRRQHPEHRPTGAAAALGSYEVAVVLSLVNRAVLRWLQAFKQE